MWLKKRGTVFFRGVENKPTSVFETDFTIKVNVKKQRRFDRSTVIFKLNGNFFFFFFECAKIYVTDYKNANKILTKTLKYLHRNNTHTQKNKKNCGMKKR